MGNYKIAVLAGDGIGKEVVDEGLKVIKAASQKYGFKYSTTDFPHGTDHYLATKELFPDSVITEMKSFDAIYLGAIGDPRVEVGLVERAIVAGLRFKLDLFVNLRPVKLYDESLCPLKGRKPEDIDMVICRENTEGAYSMITGMFKTGTPDEITTQLEVNTRKGVERIIRYAFELCRKRNKKKRLTLVDKANAMRAQDIWTRVFAEVGEDYPDIEKDHAYVDAACMWMVQNPAYFDTVVCPNLFGDIITDLGAAIQGGLGIAASGNIHPGRVSMFEPIHGSAPKYRGKNVASPIAAIAAGAMMLDFLGEAKAADAINKAIERVFTGKKITDISARSGISTQKQGDMVVEEMLNQR